MAKHPRPANARLRNRMFALPAVTLAVLTIAACSSVAQSPSLQPRISPAGGHPLSDGVTEEDYGEFLATEDELAALSTNDIAKSIRLNAEATVLGRVVYERNCAACHGEDLKGRAEAHAPDLTDDEWRFSGDDLQTGGLTKLPSDVEWTVRHGVRSGDPKARGVEADMLAFDPQYRNEHDLMDFGRIKTVTPEDIDEMAEYVLQLSGQRADPVKARQGETLFLDNAKGNCFDCHTEEATGNSALGSTNLTRKETFLYGSDKASIVESITKGRRGVMPAFDRKLRPAELKAVSVFVFSQAAKPPS